MAEIEKKKVYGDQIPSGDRALIQDITQSLDCLNAQLRDRDDHKIRREQEDLDFAETLKQLRKLLLDKP